MQEDQPPKNRFFNFNVLVIALLIVAGAFLGYIRIFHPSYFDNLSFNSSRQRSQVAAILPVAPPGTWVQIPNTAFYPAVAFEAKPGSPGGTPELWSPQGLFAYSGTELATVGGKLGFVLWGGGDGDSPNNQLLFTPFDGSGPVTLSGPYLAPDKVYRYPQETVNRETLRSISRNQPGVTADCSTDRVCSPKSRHTYRSLRVFSLGGTSYVFNYGGGMYVPGGGTNATRIFDLTQTFTQAMARPDMGWQRRADAPEGSVASSSGWDDQKQVIVTRSKSFLSTYDPMMDQWAVRGVPGGGSDYQSGVAMDVVGRKMYVLAWNLAEAIDLDTYAVTKIVAPWTSLLGGFPEGPGVAWHSASKRIVLWTGGQTIYLIDPKTNVVTKVAMGGATLTAPSGSGIYGSFDVIPGTDQVVLVNSVFENVFIGTVPFDSPTTAAPAPTPTPTPTPSPSPVTTPSAGLINVPAGQSIPSRQWVERRLPFDPSCNYADGQSAKAELCGLGPSKHERMFYHPGLKSMVIGGGDRPVGGGLKPYGNTGTGSEIIGLDVFNDKWTTIREFCVPGEVQPARPDNVVWAFDAKRNRGIMTPGYYVGSGPGFSINPSGCGAIEGIGGYALDFATRKWIGPDAVAGLPVPPSGWGGDNNSSFGVYDPVTD